MVRDRGGSSSSGSDQARRLGGYVGGRSTASQSLRGRSVQPSIQEKQPPVPTGLDIRIYDEQNEDVTPRPLLAQDHHGRVSAGAPFVDSTSLMPPDASQTSFMAGMTSSIVAGLPFSKSIFSASQSDQFSEDSFDFFDEDVGTITFDKGMVREQTMPGTPTASELNKEIKVILTETETISMLDISDYCVASDTTEAAQVLERNAKYDETETIPMLDIADYCVASDTTDTAQVLERNAKYDELVKSRPGNDRYVERSMNTFNEPLKHKVTQTGKISSKDVSVTASWWDLYDTMEGQREDKAKEEEDILTVGQRDDGETMRDATSVLNVPDITVPKMQNWQLGQMSTVAGSSSASSALDSMFGIRDQSPGIERNKINIDDECARILSYDSVPRQLQILERALNLNTYQAKQATYRGFQIIEDIDKLPPVESSADTSGSFSPFPPSTLPPSTPPALENDDSQQEGGAGSQTNGLDTGAPTASESRQKSGKKEQKPAPREKSAVKTGENLRPASALRPDLDLGLHIERLFSYHCSLTKGHNVSTLTWNPSNPDLIAVGYGQFEYSKQKSGLVCCWSIKNPEFPERVYVTPVGVMSVGFSKSQPNLLAAGLYNGGITIYNVSTNNTDQVMDNFDTGNRHTGPVWRLGWITKNGSGAVEDRREVLVSTASDGRITQWKIRKGFEGSDLMKLKRIQTKQNRGRKTDALISKFSGGLCFDFCPSDSNLYLIGTEEGHIHKCSCSYNEQYLDSYLGHTGPVYSVKWSPYDRDVFLSCSADWTIKIWHQDQQQPLISLSCSTKSISDVAWSPFSSTMFACVNETELELWDLSQDMLDPVLQYAPISATDNKLSCLGFAENSNCLFVGDSEGQVIVYQLCGLPRPHHNQSIFGFNQQVAELRAC